MNSFLQLFLANLKMFVREKQGLYWTILMPSIIYIALSVLPIGNFAGGQIPYSNYLLPGIIAMTIMQGGIYSLAYWLVDLKSRGIVKRLLATPIKQWQLALALVCSRLVVVLAQTTLLTLLGIFGFHATFAGNILLILLFVLLGGAIFLGLGLLISNFAKSYDSAAPITSAIGLPLTFLGNIFFPTNNLPYVLKIFSKILPITYLSDGLRQAYLQIPGTVSQLVNLSILTIWLAIIVCLIIWLFKLSE